MQNGSYHLPIWNDSVKLLRETSTDYQDLMEYAIATHRALKDYGENTIYRQVLLKAIAPNGRPDFGVENIKNQAKYINLLACDGIVSAEAANDFLDRAVSGQIKFGERDRVNSKGHYVKSALTIYQEFDKAVYQYMFGKRLIIEKDKRDFRSSKFVRCYNNRSFIDFYLPFLSVVKQEKLNDDILSDRAFAILVDKIDHKGYTLFDFERILNDCIDFLCNEFSEEYTISDVMECKAIIRAKQELNDLASINRIKEEDKNDLARFNRNREKLYHLTTSFFAYHDIIQNYLSTVYKNDYNLFEKEQIRIIRKLKTEEGRKKAFDKAERAFEVTKYAEAIGYQSGIFCETIKPQNISAEEWNNIVVNSYMYASKNYPEFLTKEEIAKNEEAVAEYIKTREKIKEDIQQQQATKRQAKTNKGKKQKDKRESTGYLTKDERECYIVKPADNTYDDNLLLLPVSLAEALNIDIGNSVYLDALSNRAMQCLFLSNNKLFPSYVLPIVRFFSDYYHLGVKLTIPAKRIFISYNFSRRYNLDVDFVNYINTLDNREDQEAIFKQYLNKDAYNELLNEDYNKNPYIDWEKRYRMKTNDIVKFNAISDGKTKHSVILRQLIFGVMVFGGKALEAIIDCNHYVNNRSRAQTKTEAESDLVNIPLNIIEEYNLDIDKVLYCMEMPKKEEQENYIKRNFGYFVLEKIKAESRKISFDSNDCKIDVVVDFINAFNSGKDYSQELYRFATMLFLQVLKRSTDQGIRGNVAKSEAKRIENETYTATVNGESVNVLGDRTVHTSNNGYNKILCDIKGNALRELNSLERLYNISFNEDTKDSSVFEFLNNDRNISLNDIDLIQDSALHILEFCKMCRDSGVSLYTAFFDNDIIINKPSLVFQDGKWFHPFYMQKARYLLYNQVRADIRKKASVKIDYKNKYIYLSDLYFENVGESEDHIATDGNEVIEKYNRDPGIPESTYIIYDEDKKEHYIKTSGENALMLYDYDLSKLGIEDGKFDTFCNFDYICNMCKLNEIEGKILQLNVLGYTGLAIAKTLKITKSKVDIKLHSIRKKALNRVFPLLNDHFKGIVTQAIAGQKENIAAIAVVQLDEKMREVNRFRSMKSAEIATGAKNQVISRAIKSAEMYDDRHRLNSAGGYFWARTLQDGFIALVELKSQRVVDLYSTMISAQTLLGFTKVAIEEYIKNKTIFSYNWNGTKVDCTLKMISEDKIDGKTLSKALSEQCDEEYIVDYLINKTKIYKDK